MNLAMVLQHRSKTLHFPIVFISYIIAFSLAFLVAVVVVSTIIGALVSFFGGTFNSWVVGLITIVSLAFAVFLSQFYLCRKAGSLLGLALAMTLFYLLFQHYSPVVEIGQDPGVNFYKGMNLVNFGTLSRPMEPLSKLVQEKRVPDAYWAGYSKLQNGLAVKDGKLDSDMNAGGAYFYAYFGRFNRPWVFLAQILLSLAGATTLFFVLERFIENSSSTVSSFLTACFVLAPSFVFFGRAPYSEIPALVCYLLVILLQSDERKAAHWATLLLTGLTVLAGFIARIDYVLLLFAGVVILTYHRPVAGLLLSAAASGTIAVVHKLFTINYEGTTGANSLFFFRHDHLCIWLVFLASLLLFRVLKLDMRKILEMKLVSGVLAIATLAAVLAMYRNNLIPPDQFQKEIIHGSYLRTYNEEIVDRLFSVLPSIIVVVGLLALPILAANSKASPFSRFALLALAVPYLYSFYESQNSPQLYWNIRRYLYVTMPAMLISFSVILSFLQKRERFLLSFAALLLAGNIWFEARQGVDYAGLDKTVRKFVRTYPTDKGFVLLYQPELRYQASALISYAGYDFLPVSDKSTLKSIVDSFRGERRLLLLDRKECPGVAAQKFLYEREAVPADFDALPRGSTKKEIPLYIYRVRGELPEEFVTCLGLS